MKIERDYQGWALHGNDKFPGLYPCLEKYLSTLLVMATGLGKTYVLARVANEWKNGNVLCLAHRIELVDQMADTLSEELGYRPSVEQGLRGLDPDTLFAAGHVVVGSIQSMITENRLRKFRRHPFGLIIIDECFPAGTKIDGSNIEDIGEGDIITSFCPMYGRVVRRKVVRTFRKPAPLVMVRITAGQQTVTATLSHPFFTGRGWVDAGRIKVGDKVRGLWTDIYCSSRTTEIQISQGMQDSLVYQAMPSGMDEKTRPGELRSVRGGVRGFSELATVEGQERENRLLLGEMHADCNGRPVSTNHCRDESEVRFGQDDGKKSHAGRECQNQGVGNNEVARAQADFAGRERSRPNEAGEITCRENRHEALRFEHSQDARLSDSLQTGPWQSNSETSRGDRWRKSRDVEGERTRCSEGRFLESARVDSVEVLEFAGHGRHGSLCQNGYVYNLEVEGEHTYIANGFAVHNCHRATSPSYVKLVERYREIDPKCRVMGVTATPNRTDGTALGLIFESVAFEMGIVDGIDSGWLVDIHQKFAVVEDLDLSKIPLRKNEFGEMDFKAAELEALLSQEGPLHAMSRPVLDCTTNGEQAIIFAASVSHAHLWAAVLNHYRPGCASAIDGTMQKGDGQPRTEIVKAYKDGRLQFLLNFNITTEGFDAPRTSFIIMGRPTKSLLVYTQMLGRGTRALKGVVDGIPTSEGRKDAIAASIKPWCTVLDFVGNSRHQVVTATDVLGGNYDVNVREAADEIIGANGTAKGNVRDALTKARAAMLLEVEEERRRPMRNAVKDTKIDYQLRDVDAFGGRAPVVKPKTSRGGSTDAQIAALVNLGVERDTAEGYSRKQAGAVMVSVGKTRCTAKQAATLKKFGYDPADFNVDSASEQITAIAENGWRRPT